MNGNTVYPNAKVSKLNVKNIDWIYFYNYIGISIPPLPHIWLSFFCCKQIKYSMMNSIVFDNPVRNRRNQKIFLQKPMMPPIRLTRVKPSITKWVSDDCALLSKMKKIDPPLSGSVLLCSAWYLTKVQGSLRLLV